MTASVLVLADYATLSPSTLADRYAQADQQLRTAAQVLIDAPSPTFTDHVQPILEAERAGLDAYLLFHLSSVADTPDVREAFDRVEALETATSTWAADNEALYEAYAKVAQDQTLTDWQSAWLKLAQRPYERRGFGLPEATKARLGEIAQRLTELSTQFSRNLLDTNKAWHLVLTEDQVKDIPANRLSALAETGQRWNSPTGYAVDLLAPAVSAVLTYCPDRALREAVWRADNTRGAPAGPGGAERSNLPLLLETLALRAEKAQLCGSPDYATWSIQDKMAKTPQAAIDLLTQLREQARPAAQAELVALQDFARDRLGLEELLPWDQAFAAEKQLSERLGFPAATIAQYFPVDHVIDQLLDVSSRLFGVQFEQDASVSTWDSAVKFYRVLENDQVLGGFYLDMFARPGKRQGAWKSTLRHRSESEAPVANMCLNATPPSAGATPTLRHGEVVTLFHEFGHGLHLLLGQAPFSGVDMAGVERDAIECPSQMMENFAWDPATLARLSSHVETGQPMPPPMIQSLIGARNHNVGLALVRQMTFGLWDLSLHTGAPPETAETLFAQVDAIRDQTHVLPMPEGTRDQMLTSFAHIFSGGYSAGYYGYLWSEVLSADAFAAFTHAPDGPVSPTQGQKFRTEILAIGAVRDFGQSFEAFRGRGPSVDALVQARGLSGHTVEAPSPKPRRSA